MKRLIVPALAMGLAIAFVAPARAGGLFDCLHRDKCDPCKPKCESPCKPACPKISWCKPRCESPCKPACPKPCDPCGGGHLSKLKGLFHGHSCSSGCNSGCGSPCGAPAEAGPATPEAGPGVPNHKVFDNTPAPRLNPVPTNNTSMRTTTRSSGY